MSACATQAERRVIPLPRPLKKGARSVPFFVASVFTHCLRNRIAVMVYVRDIGLQKMGEKRQCNAGEYDQTRGDNIQFNLCRKNPAFT